MTHNCKESSYKVDKKFHKMLKQLRIENIFDVPIRRNCMTGSGQKNQCHKNVGLLNEKYGGKTALGFALFYDSQNYNHISKIDYPYFDIVSHSCWITPEGKLVDVTLGHNDDDYVLFAPIKIFDGKKEHWSCYLNFRLKRNYMKKGFQICQGVRNNWEHIYFNIKQRVLDSELLFQHYD
jgi:hypothetical protein